jgi:hypothetical protein
MILSSLSPLISQLLVPFEDWISTVSFLILRSTEEEDDQLLHSTIHSICMACTSPSHVQSLVGEGILGYWERVLLQKTNEGTGDIGVGVLEAISHLTAIDKELGSKLASMTEQIS